MRHDAFSRRLMQESRLDPADLIWPVFVLEDPDGREAIQSMPGIDRLGIEQLLKESEQLVRMRVPAIALFPVVAADGKSDDAAEAYNPEGLV